MSGDTNSPCLLGLSCHSDKVMQVRSGAQCLDAYRVPSKPKQLGRYCTSWPVAGQCTIYTGCLCVVKKGFVIFCQIPFMPESAAPPKLTGKTQGGRVPLWVHQAGTFCMPRPCRQAMARPTSSRSSWGQQRPTETSRV